MNRSHLSRCRLSLPWWPPRAASFPAVPPVFRVIVLLVFLFPPTGWAEDLLPWGGSVLDLVGRGIPGVEVLAYPAGRDASGRPPGIFRTDERGRFRLSGLVPGSYFLALNKPGYEVLLAQVNTRWISRLTLTLIPGGPVMPPSTDVRGDSMDWVLRLPRTDLLKEVHATGMVAVASAGGEGSGSGPGRRDPAGGAAMLAGRFPVNGEVEQWFTTDPSFGGGSPGMASSSGRTTALTFDGDLLGRGNWRVGGVLGTLNTEGSQAGVAGGERDEGAGRFRAAMDYDFGAEDTVRFRARYDRDSYQSGSMVSSSSPSAQEVRTLGYQAGWLRKMDEGSGFEMNVGFLQAAGRVPEGMPGLDLIPGSEQDKLLQDRRWNAGALYGFNLFAEHRVSVGAATQFYRYEEPDGGWVLAPIQPDRSIAEAGQRGWSVSLSGEDSWKISEPISLILGLDYHRTESAEGYSALVPRVGARREGSRSLIQGEILLRIDAPGSLANGDLSLSGSSEPGENSLGYKAEILQRIGASWTVSGHAKRSPIGGEMEPGWLDPRGPGDPGALLLADPSSVTEEIGVEVSKRVKGVKGTFGTDQGRIRGRVAAHLDGAPIQVLGQGDVRYLTLKASASVPVTDTEVRFGYRRLDGLESPFPSGDPYQASRLDLAVLQQIPLLAKHLPADWRLLLAYQTLFRDPSSTDETLAPALPERVRRLSGGVGVKF